MRPWVLQSWVASPEYSDQTEERHQGASLIITERLSAWSREQGTERRARVTSELHLKIYDLSHSLTDLCLSVCMHDVHLRARMCVCLSHGTPVETRAKEWALSFHHVDLRDGTQFVRLGS